MADEHAPTPYELERAAVEETGKWPEGWGPFHRHFANDAIHRDDGPECDQPGTPYRVYVFDPEYLNEHERAIAEGARAEERQRWVGMADAAGRGKHGVPLTIPGEALPRAVLSDRHNWAGDAHVLRNLANNIFPRPADEATASYLHRLADRLAQLDTAAADQDGQ